MNACDHTRLLFGPYRQPRLRKGDRATCLFKDTDVVVTGRTRGARPGGCGPQPPTLDAQSRRAGCAR
jgi:hypothetical protein